MTDWKEAEKVIYKMAIGNLARHIMAGRVDAFAASFHLEMALGVQKETVLNDILDAQKNEKAAMNEDSDYDPNFVFSVT